MSNAFPHLFSPLRLGGRTLANRVALPATLTNYGAGQRVTDRWKQFLVERALGGCALVVSEIIAVDPEALAHGAIVTGYDDANEAGFRATASEVEAAGATLLGQLWHPGRQQLWHPTRSPQGVSDQPDALSWTVPHVMSAAELRRLVDAFTGVARRLHACGFHGVELHGAHGYLLCQFLSGSINHRDDRYGGSLEHRSRVLLEIIEHIRERCRPDFLLAVRLSPERFGMRLAEVQRLSQQLADGGRVDLLDLSLWDCFKEPAEQEHQGAPLIERALPADRKGMRVGVAGKLHDPADAQRALEAGADLAILGRVAILHHDYPRRLATDPGFAPVRPPVSAAYLAREGLGPRFVDYMRSWEGFVAQ